MAANIFLWKISDLIINILNSHSCNRIFLFSIFFVHGEKEEETAVSFLEIISKDDFKITQFNTFYCEGDRESFS